MLKRILQTKQEEVSALYSRRDELEARARDVSMPRYSFVGALKSPQRLSALIAEVKKASPSKGVLRPDFKPVEIARAYQQAGADALSVLTDVTYFQGSGKYI